MASEIFEANLEQIADSRYGRDMRSAIHDCIEELGELVDGLSQLATRVSDLEDTVEELGESVSDLSQLTTRVSDLETLVSDLEDRVEELEQHQSSGVNASIQGEKLLLSGTGVSVANGILMIVDNNVTVSQEKLIL